MCDLVPWPGIGPRPSALQAWSESQPLEVPLPCLYLGFWSDNTSFPVSIIWIEYWYLFHFISFYSAFCFPGGSDGNESASNAEDLGLIAGLGRSPSRRSRKWQPTPVHLPGEFHGQRNLVGYSPWGHKESDTTKQLTVSSEKWSHLELSYCLLLLLH